MLKKGLADLPETERWYNLRYGENCDREALQAVHAIHNAVMLRSEPPDETISETFKNEAWEIIAERYRRDWANHDGSFFIAMGRAMEVHMRANDPCCVFVANEIIQRELRGLSMPTEKEMHAIAKAAGIKSTRKTIGRAFRYWGRKSSPDKRGGARR